jgi:predicted amidohydrolase YtcJ
MTASPLAPDIVLCRGRFRTMDPSRPTATALAVKDGWIVAVGEEAEVEPLAGSATRVVDLGGATVVPGIVDAHNHLLSTGHTLRQVQLYGCRTISEIRAKVAERVAILPPGSWIVGRGWDESLLAEGRHPTRHDLDRVAPDHPVLLHRVWNKLSCNSQALALAGVSANTPDPPADVLYAGSFERTGPGSRRGCSATGPRR